MPTDILTTAAHLAQSDVPRPLSHFGTSPRNVLDHTQPRGDTAATVAIASISDQDWYISRTHGVYHIPACPKIQPGPSGSTISRAPLTEASGVLSSRGPDDSVPYALLLITSRGDALDLGDDRRFPFTISAREIAEDLLQDLHDHGVFVCAGPRPTPEELAAAVARRDACYHRLVTEGDTLWARGHSFREISDLHRRAAMALGAEREWAYVPMRLSDCPACGEKVKSGVAVCKHCHAILDAEKAAQHGLVGPSANTTASAATLAPASATNAAPSRPAEKSAPR
ncbi:MAG TPA: hypothetical protein VJO53_14600 [Candidatus Acidoferrales bacterium]|nr:hypothetical protein [Candidatus Acidoferrales bacterium]